jgi:hypothetical protein
MSASLDWTVNQAAEFYLELALVLVEGADEADTIRPRLALESLAPAGVDIVVPDDLDVAGLRRYVRKRRGELALESVSAA